jgi:hypothetical protein
VVINDWEIHAIVSMLELLVRNDEFSENGLWNSLTAHPRLFGHQDLRLLLFIPFDWLLGDSKLLQEGALCLHD